VKFGGYVEKGFRGRLNTRKEGEKLLSGKKGTGKDYSRKASSTGAWRSCKQARLLATPLHEEDFKKITLQEVEKARTCGKIVSRWGKGEREGKDVEGVTEERATKRK